VAPPGRLRIEAVDCHTFQEICAASAGSALSIFAPGKSLHFNPTASMTPMCDCFGSTTRAILPDPGHPGSDDILPPEHGTLDLTAGLGLIEENLATSLAVHHRSGHHFERLHGSLKEPYRALGYTEALGLGS
jgi:uncharacterized Fe-S center protein